MNKVELVKAILKAGEIHHNIRIDFNKMDYTEDDNFDWNIIAGYMIDDFKEEFESREIADTGNRNLCGCTKSVEVICKKHDIWSVYTHGRMGATLYWEKYWKSENSGFRFKYYDSELEEMPITELRRIYKEICIFNSAVKDLMFFFYKECKDKLIEARAEKKEEEKEEAEYQVIREKVKTKGVIKRLVNDLL